jgi:undecaprenyl-diphosphatase
MAIPLSEGLLLGVARGVTEVFPLSGEGHLALGRMLFGGGPGAPLSVFLHLGVLAAVLLVVRKRAARALVEGARGILRPSLLHDTPGGRDAVVVAAVTFPTLVIGLGLVGPAEAWTRSPTMVGLLFLGSALALGSTYWAPRGDLDTPTFWGAALVGVGQGAAVLPGLSPMAVALTTFLWLGLRAERAFELSLLASVPALCLAVLVDARHGLSGDAGGWATALGACAAFGAGVLALRLLRGVVVRRATALFAFYLVPLGLATLAWGYARP